MKAVLYARVSSKEQEREGFSIPAQLELLRGYAKKNGFEILEEYSEAETAKTAGRQRFLEMVDFAKKYKEPLCILVEKTDRLYRNFKDFLLIDDLISQRDAEIHLVKENETIGKNANSSKKLMHGFKVLIAKNYIDNLSEEVRKGHRQKVLQGGWPTGAPYGYSNDRNTKNIIPNPSEAPLVIRAFQLYGSNMYSIEAVIDKLQEEGFVYRNSSVRIHRSRLHEIFKNAAYIGKIPFKGEVYEGKHEPIISIESWLKVQAALRKDNKPVSMQKRDFIYRGVLSCGECGTQMVGEIKKGKYIYYRCLLKKNGCSQGYISESVIDQEVSDFIAGLQLPSDAKQQILTVAKQMQGLLENTANEEADRLNNLIKRIRTKRRAAYEDKIGGVIDAEMWQELDRDLLEQIQTLEVRRSKITDADTHYYRDMEMAVELPRILSTQWITANFEERKLFLNFTQSNFFIKDGNAHLQMNEAIQAIQKMGVFEGDRELQDVVRNFTLVHMGFIRELHKAFTVSA